MANMDNPAGRLLHWFTEVAAAYPQQQEALVTAWSNLIDVDPQTTDGQARLLRHASLLADQCVEVRSEAAELPDFMDSHLVIEHFHQVEGAVGHFMSMNQVTLKSQLEQIQPTGHHSLRMLDAALHRFRPQGTASDETVQSLIDRVSSLIESLDEVEVDDEVRDFVSIRFTEVLQALQDSRVKGAKVVERTTDAVMSHYHREPAMWRRVMESTVGTAIAEILVVLLLHFTDIAPTADALPPGTPQPVIEQIIHIHVEQTGPEDTPELGGDVVDGEIVEEEGDPPAKPGS